MRKLREEVDEVLGDEPVRLDHIAKLKYTSGAHPLFTTPCSIRPARGAMLTRARAGLWDQRASGSRSVSTRPRRCAL